MFVVCEINKYDIISVEKFSLPEKDKELVAVEIESDRDMLEAFLTKDGAKQLGEYLIELSNSMES